MYSQKKTNILHFWFQRTGKLPIDQIEEGMYLEIQFDLEPDLVWPVKVVENVGGRLLLRYEGHEAATNDFWLFYLHHRVHPIGWAGSHDCRYESPHGECIYYWRIEFIWYFIYLFLILVKYAHG